MKRATNIILWGIAAALLAALFLTALAHRNDPWLYRMVSFLKAPLAPAQAGKDTIDSIPRHLLWRGVAHAIGIGWCIMVALAYKLVDVWHIQATGSGRVVDGVAGGGSIEAAGAGPLSIDDAVAKAFARNPLAFVRAADLGPVEHEQEQVAVLRQAVSELSNPNAHSQGSGRGGTAGGENSMRQAGGGEGGAASSRETGQAASGTAGIRGFFHRHDPQRLVATVGIGGIILQIVLFAVLSRVLQ